MRQGTCPKCRGSEIIQAIPAEYANNNLEYEMAVTAEPRSILYGRNPKDPYGKLRLLVCKTCGYTEWWTLDPENIPIGPEYKTAMMKHEE